MQDSPNPNSEKYPDKQRPRGVTARALLLGSLLIPFNAYWIIRLERVMFGPYPSTISLFANVVFMLFLLAGLNAVLRRFLPRYAFSQGEQLTIYTMLAISTGLAGLDGPVSLDQLIAQGGWFGKTSGLGSLLHSFPSWLVVNNHKLLRGHFLGDSSFYQPAVLHAWITPILAWTAFITMLMLAANCINVLVRREWADHERLTFPIIWLPMAMTEGGSGSEFFQNRLMWAGFALAAGLNLWNGIAFLHPSIPQIPLGITDLTSLFTAKPWNAIDWLPITFYPMVIGLSFLLPLDLLFSCWFFYLFWKMQMVASRGMGWDVTPDFPFIKEQGFGAIMGLFLFYLWSGRRAYKNIWRRAWGRETRDETDRSEENQAISERAALLGLGGGLLGLLVFCMAAGVTWWVAIAFFAIFLPTLIVVTRIRAELGSPVHDFHFMGPDAMIPRITGIAPLHKSDLAFFTLSYGMTRAHRSDTMPIGLEGLQMAHARKLEARKMFGAIILATVLGMLSAFWACEQQAYVFGVSAKFNQGVGQAQEAFSRTSGWLGGGLNSHPNLPAVMAMGVGLLTTWGLLAMRMRLFGFPFHPIGYAISSSWAINLVWMPMFIAWFLKGLTLRFGGLRSYRKFLPFFMGLILGDCVMGCIWGLLSMALHTRTYNFFGS